MQMEFFIGKFFDIKKIFIKKFVYSASGSKK